MGARPTHRASDACATRKRATSAREGWGLGDAAWFFFPMTMTSADTLARTDALLADEGLDARLGRVLVDAGDELRGRLECLRRFAR